jgi:hypothetical protein
MMPGPGRTPRLTRMVKADARRLTWFLDLQRLWHFPKFFMAPPAYLRPRRGLMVADLETTGGGSRSPRGERPSSMGSNGFRAPLQPHLGRATSPIDSPGLTKVLRFVRAAASGSNSSRSSWRAASNSALVANRAPTFEAHAGNRATARHGSSTLQENSRLTDGSGDPERRPEKSVSFAPIHVFRPDERSGSFEHHPDPPQIATGADEIAFGRPHFQPSEQPTFIPASADQDQFSSPGRDGIASGGRPRQGGPAISTLHIDGSALGRWAVQHLERTLGKPATGMTGVDPRATIPRSRVAPF